MDRPLTARLYVISSLPLLLFTALSEIDVYDGWRILLLVGVVLVATCVGVWSGRRTAWLAALALTGALLWLSLLHLDRYLYPPSIPGTVVSWDGFDAVLLAYAVLALVFLTWSSTIRWFWGKHDRSTRPLGMSGART